MATFKTYTVAGTSKHNGNFKVRFANDMLRTKVLDKHDHTEVILVELPRAMTKLGAVQHIATLPEFDNVGSKTAIMDYLDRNDSAPVKAKVPAKAKAKVDPAAKKATVTADEDAPF